MEGRLACTRVIWSGVIGGLRLSVHSSRRAVLQPHFDRGGFVSWSVAGALPPGDLTSAEAEATRPAAAGLELSQHLRPWGSGDSRTSLHGLILGTDDERPHISYRRPRDSGLQEG